MIEIGGAFIPRIHARISLNETAILLEVIHSRKTLAIQPIQMCENAPYEITMSTSMSTKWSNFAW